VGGAADDLGSLDELVKAEIRDLAPGPWPVAESAELARGAMVRLRKRWPCSRWTPTSRY
jgi:hypothetical protein